MKKGQISLFIIAGMVIFLVLGILIYSSSSKDNINNRQMESLNSAKSEISLAMSSCLEVESTKARAKWGWTKTDQISREIKNEFDECMLWDSWTKKGIRIFRETPVITSQNQDSALVIDLKYDVKISQGENSLDISGTTFSLSKISEMSLKFDDSGRTLEDYSVISRDGIAELRIRKGTAVRNDAMHVDKITLKVIPSDSGNSYTASTSSYSFEPSGTSFSPAAEFSFFYNKELANSFSSPEDIMFKTEFEGSPKLISAKKEENGRLFFDLRHFSDYDIIDLSQTRFCTVNERLDLLRQVKNLDPDEQKFLECFLDKEKLYKREVNNAGGVQVEFGKFDPQLNLDSFNMGRYDSNGQEKIGCKTCYWASQCGDFESLVSPIDRVTCLRNDNICSPEQSLNVDYYCKQESESCNLHADYRCSNPKEAPEVVIDPQAAEFKVIDGPLRIRTSPKLLADAENVFPYVQAQNGWVFEIKEKIYENSIYWGKIESAKDGIGNEVEGISGKWVAMVYEGKDTMIPVGVIPDESPAETGPEPEPVVEGNEYILTDSDRTYRIRSSPKLLPDIENVIGTKNFAMDETIKIKEIMKENYGTAINLWGRLEDDSYGFSGELWIALELKGVKYAEKKIIEGKKTEPSSESGKGKEGKKSQPSYVPPVQTYFEEKRGNVLLKMNYEPCIPLCKKNSEEADLVIISTTKLDLDGESGKRLIDSVQSYIDVLKTEDITAKFILIDAKKGYWKAERTDFMTGDEFGIRITDNFMDSTIVDSAIERVYDKLHFRYLILVGDEKIIPVPVIEEPRPLKDAGSPDHTISFYDNRLRAGQMHSTSPYEDMNHDSKPDIALSRLYDQPDDSSHSTLANAFSNFARDRSYMVFNAKKGILYATCEGVGPTINGGKAFNENAEIYNNERCSFSDSFVRSETASEMYPVPRNCLVSDGLSCKGQPDQISDDLQKPFGSLNMLVSDTHGNSGSGDWVVDNKNIISCKERSYDSSCQECARINGGLSNCLIDVQQWLTSIDMSRRLSDAPDSVFPSACFTMKSGSIQNYPSSRFVEAGSRAFFGFYDFGAGGTGGIREIRSGKPDGSNSANGERLGDIILESRRNAFNKASSEAHFLLSFGFSGDPTIRIIYMPEGDGN